MHRRGFLRAFSAAVAALFAGLFQRTAGAIIQISGNYAGTIPAGTTGQIVGDVNLTGDLIVEGTLIGINTFAVTGNGFQILVQNGGVVQLAGIVKSGWVRWGDPVSGWVTGDRLGVAPSVSMSLPPTDAMIKPTVVIWQGSWGATSRPANSPDVTMVDGSVAKPEVANLTRTIRFTNLRRFHLHEGAGVSNLKHLAIVDSGKTGVLGDYPLHFHLNGNTSRGSVVEGVVVEGGKNHAFVPHGSHGIEFLSCVAFNTIDEPFWWDPPPTASSTINFTNDTIWDGCLVSGVVASTPTIAARLSGFLLDGGAGNKCNNSVVAGFFGGPDSSGFHWPEKGGGVWQFNNNVAHNCNKDGIFTWQNSGALTHLIDNFTAFHCGKAGVEHGAYVNVYKYRNLVLTGTGQWGLKVHARTPPLGQNPPPVEMLTFEDVVSDRRLEVAPHSSVGTLRPTMYVRCQMPGVTYREEGTIASWNIFEDCGLVPANFLLTIIRPDSIIEIKEAGVLTHRWAGAWT